jgi:hypothetical protein
MPKNKKIEKIKKMDDFLNVTPSLFPSFPFESLTQGRQAHSRNVYTTLLPVLSRTPNHSTLRHRRREAGRGKPHRGNQARAGKHTKPKAH